MIHLFYGNDTKTKRASYDKYKKSKQSADHFIFSKHDFDRNQIESLYGSNGLFFTHCTVFFENVFDNEEMMEFLLSHLEDFKNSGNDFVFLEGKLLKAETEVFKKAKAEIELFEIPKEKLEKYDNFLLANDFGAKDKLNLWIHYRQAVDLGVGLEELTGVLFWKAKDMLVKKSYGKFKEEELKNFVSKISYLLPKARGEGIDDEIAFEQFLLEVF